MLWRRNRYRSDRVLPRWGTNDMTFFNATNLEPLRGFNVVIFLLKINSQLIPAYKPFFSYEELNSPFHILINGGLRFQVIDIPLDFFLTVKA